jgi:hypothetical protein
VAIAIENAKTSSKNAINGIDVINVKTFFIYFEFWRKSEAGSPKIVKISNGRK